MHIFRQKFILISLALSQKIEFEKWPIRTWFKYTNQITNNKGTDQTVSLLLAYMQHAGFHITMGI